MSLGHLALCHPGRWIRCVCLSCMLSHIRPSLLLPLPSQLVPPSRKRPTGATRHNQATWEPETEALGIALAGSEGSCAARWLDVAWLTVEGTNCQAWRPSCGFYRHGPRLASLLLTCLHVSQPAVKVDKSCPPGTGHSQTQSLALAKGAGMRRYQNKCIQNFQDNVPKDRPHPGARLMHLLPPPC